MHWDAALTLSSAFFALAWTISSLARARADVMVARAEAGIGSDGWIAPYLSGRKANCPEDFDGQEADEEAGR